MDSEKVFDLLQRWHDLRSQGVRASVDELCRESPELTGKMASLVRAIEATDWLEDPYDQVKGSNDHAEELALPKSVGRYELRELIGQGGFGYVYKAWDPELHRHVAVKIARPSRAASPQYTQQFLDEARRAAAVKHPAIVPVHDVGCQGQWLYIVSDLVEGSDLGAAAGHERLKVAESVRIVACTADALEGAHRGGLLHRDVKPANILLDHHGNVFLADFGIAVTQEQMRGGGTSGHGTFAYMSPEQIAAAEIGPASDIYSLGVVLYELLTGRRPAAAKASTNGKSREIVPPSCFDPAVPSSLDAVCLRALDANPHERFSSASDFATALRNTTAGRQRRYGIYVLAAAVVGIAAVAFFGLTGLVVRQDKSRPPTPIASGDGTFPASAPTTTPSTMPSIAGAAWFDGHYYRYFREKVTWRQAVRRCEEMGGTLAMIKSQQQQDFIAHLVQGENAYIYIGLSDERHENDWRWLDGTRPQYINWYPGEPNHFGGVEHWAALVPPAKSMWNDIAVGHSQVGGFVCQWGPGKPPLYVPPPQPPPPDPASLEPGLTADYYGDASLERHVETRIDANIDLNDSTPRPGVNDEPFSVRWRGYLKPPANGPYTIVVRSCNGSRLILDGIVIFDDLVPTKRWFYMGKRNLTDTYHTFQVEFKHANDSVLCSVRWGVQHDSGQEEKPIEPECFFHEARGAQ